MKCKRSQTENASRAGECQASVKHILLLYYFDQFDSHGHVSQALQNWWDVTLITGHNHICQNHQGCFLCFVLFFHLLRCLFFYGGEECKPCELPVSSCFSLWFRRSAPVLLTFSLSASSRLQWLSDTVALRIFDIAFLGLLYSLWILIQLGLLAFRLSGTLPLILWASSLI